MEVLEKSKVLAYISPMQDIQRRLAPVLLDAARHFSAVVVTGPRRAEGEPLFSADFFLKERLTKPASTEFTRATQNERHQIT